MFWYEDLLAIIRSVTWWQTVHERRQQIIGSGKRKIEENDRTRKIGENDKTRKIGGSDRTKRTNDRTTMSSQVGREEIGRAKIG